MDNLTIDAAWVLVATFSLSLIYEIYRVAMKSSVSRHDTKKAFFIQGIPLYGISAAVIACMFLGYSWSAWLGFIYAILLILISVFYYNPVIMPERKPEMIDWFEDLAYTGLLFVAATILYYDLFRI